MEQRSKSTRQGLFLLQKSTEKRPTLPFPAVRGGGQHNPTGLQAVFPSVSHELIYRRHRDLILQNDLRAIGDKIIGVLPGEYGLPLGVEPSQAEMIGFVSPLDNFIKCQLSLKGAGHYMDDYYILVPPNMDAQKILQLVCDKAAELQLTVNMEKTHIAPLTKPFRYCKVKYRLTETGKVITNGNRDNVKRARKKFHAFYRKTTNGTMNYKDLWNSVNSIFAYFDEYNDHTRVLKLRRLFYSLLDSHRRGWKTSRR